MGTLGRLEYTPRIPRAQFLSHSMNSIVSHLTGKCFNLVYWVMEEDPVEKVEVTSGGVSYLHHGQLRMRSYVTVLMWCTSLFMMEIISLFHALPFVHHSLNLTSLVGELSNHVSDIYTPAPTVCSLRGYWINRVCFLLRDTELVYASLLVSFKAWKEGCVHLKTKCYQSSSHSS